MSDTDMWKTNGGIYLGSQVQENILAGDQSISLLYSKWHRINRFNEYTEPRHLMTIGPNGSGKTRRLLVPNLYRLTNWSTLVIDPKGELAVWTAKYRKDNGSEIFTFDPFGVIESRYPGMVEKLPYLKSQGFNPIAMLNPDIYDFPDDAKAIGEALIKVDGRETHWANSAQALVTGLIMGLRMTLEKNDSRNSIAGLREVLGFAPEKLGGFIEDLIADTKNEPAIAAKLNRFTKIAPDSRELLSILSNAVTQTDWIDSKPIQHALSGSAFDFSVMKRRPVTVYLILPPRYLETHSTWLRLMITAVLTPLIRSTAKGVPVLLMLDEFAQLGRLEVIERNMALMRGYGIKLWAILQDLSQLKDSYERRWESFIGNAGVVQCFAPHDVTTREYLAKMSGKQLYWVWSNSKSKSFTSNTNWASGTSHSDQNSRTYFRDKIYPEEALAQMSADQSVLFEANCVPRRTLLPDPSKLTDINVSGILSLADAFAEQYEVKEEE